MVPLRRSPLPPSMPVDHTSSWRTTLSARQRASTLVEADRQGAGRCKVMKQTFVLLAAAMVVHRTSAASYPMHRRAQIESLLGGLMASGASLGAGIAIDGLTPDGADAIGCFRQTNTRGAGQLIGACPDDAPNNEGGICYADCDEGYSGVGMVCWSSCPDGYADIGALCTKPEPYTRGVGYAWTFTDGFDNDGMVDRCNDDNGGEGGCEMCGAMAYPRCQEGFHAVGCNVCTPDCPDNMADVGAACAKNTLARGSSALVCPDGTEQGGPLCYDSCNEGRSGVGPVCWQSACPEEYPEACGPFCSTTADTCAAISATLAKLGWDTSMATIGASTCAVASAITSLTALVACLAPSLASGAKTAADVQRFMDTTMDGICAAPGGV